MEKTIVVRFAPSPTGPLHIGGVRTALFNYLLAKKTGGKFLIRIEDTDMNRFVPGAEDYIRRTLEWCGIIPDEDPWKGGPNAPYRQSERKAMYRQYADQLIEAGHAYYAFDTAEELDEMRKRLEAARVVAPQYNAVTRMQMRNSLTLPADEVKELLEKGVPYVVRIKMPRKEEIRLNDLVRGWVMVHSSTLDDKVLLKSDGMPTYHLANIVDDHLMGVTHVIRGEEWLPSAPLHVYLYQCFGWEAPRFAHLPLLLKPEGNGKLSKRDGDRLGFPVFTLNWEDPETGEKSTGYRERGFLPEAFVNFLALLGWNPGTNQELFTMEELINEFSIERVNSSGTKFDYEKAKWFNQQYLRKKSDREIAQYMIAELANENIACDLEKGEKIVSLLKDRAVFLQDFVNDSRIFFFPPNNYDSSVASKKWTGEIAEFFEEFARLIPAIEDFSGVKMKELLSAKAAEKGMKIGALMQPLRLAITGEGAGPDLTEIISILGKVETEKRILKAVEAISV
jgi:glutamyl-tRNA synthetase